MKNLKLTKQDIKNMQTLKWIKSLGSHLSDNGFVNFYIKPGLVKNSWILYKDHYGFKSIACVKKLSSAKTIAQLINNG